MIRIRTYTNTWPVRRGADVLLPLSKDEAAVRLHRRLVKSDDVDAGHLADIDSGRLEFSVVRKLFKRPELEGAIRRRLTDDDVTREERDQLMALLETPSYWRAALGGEDALDRFGIKRYAVPKGAHQDSFGGGASRGESGDPEGKARIRKAREAEQLERSMDFQTAVGAAKEHGWRVSKSLADGGLSLYNSRKPGEALDVNANGTWERLARFGARIAAGGPGDLGEHLSGL